MNTFTVNVKADDNLKAKLVKVLDEADKFEANFEQWKALHYKGNIFTRLVHDSLFSGCDPFVLMSRPVTVEVFETLSGLEMEKNDLYQDAQLLLELIKSNVNINIDTVSLSEDMMFLLFDDL